VSKRRITGQVLLVAAAVVAVVGTFQSLSSVVYSFPNEVPVRFDISAWDVVRDGDKPVIEASPPRFGFPVLTAGTLMLLAVVLLRSRLAAVARMVAIGAAVLHAGVTWTIAEHNLGRTREQSADAAEFVRYSFGNGMWMLIGASVVALVGAILVQQRTVEAPDDDGEEQAVIHQLEDDDTATPPYGVPVQQENP
jgi:hypothetical protein